MINSSLQQASLSSSASFFFLSLISSWIRFQNASPYSPCSFSSFSSLFPYPPCFFSSSRSLRCSSSYTLCCSYSRISMYRAYFSSCIFCSNQRRRMIINQPITKKIKTNVRAFFLFPISSFQLSVIRFTLVNRQVYKQEVFQN